MLSAPDIVAAVEASSATDLGTIRRGRAYADEGRVRQLRNEDTAFETVISGVVLGKVPYRTLIVLDREDGTVELSSACSCPMAYGCKHVVALAYAFAEAEAAVPVPDWRRVLDQVLDATGDTEESRTPHRVAVQLVLPKRRRPNPYVPEPSARPRPAVRALRSGTTKRWVQGGMGWSELGRASGPSDAVFLDPTELALLTELKIALVGRRGHLLFSNDAIDLLGATAAVWPALRRIVDHGIPLVCSDSAIEVSLASGTAQVQIDLAAREEGVHLIPGLLVDDTWYAAGDAVLIGDPPTGVVAWDGAVGRPSSRVLLAELSAPLTAPVRTWFMAGNELTVAETSAGELVEEYLPQLSRSMSISSRDGSVALPTDPTVRLRGEVTWHDDGRADLAWRWDYRQGDARQQFPVDDPAARGWRQRRTELDLLDGLAMGDGLADLLSLDVRGRGTLAPALSLRDIEAMEFARDHLPWLEEQPDVEIVTNGSPPEFRELTGAARIQFTERGPAERKNRTDWLDLEVIITFVDPQLGTVQLDLPRVLEALISGSTKIMVHRGVFVDVDRPELDRLARLVHDARRLTDQPRDGLRLTRQSHGLLADLAEFGPSEGQLRDWATASAGLRALAESGAALAEVNLPEGLTASLRSYQEEGYQWLTFLRQHRLGGVLADDMGLGKTVQTLAMIARAREESGPEAPPFLVVAPSSVLATWATESAKFTPDLRVALITASTARRGWELTADQMSGAVDVVVTSYTLFRLEASQYTAFRWSGLVLDEAQMIKNWRGKTNAALRNLEADCRFAITGTPIENNLMELWAILTLTAPGLFPHADHFRTEIAKPIEQEANAEVLAELRRRIRPVMLRRTKELVAADLPPKQEQILQIELSPRHRKIYDTHLQRERQRILKLLDDLDENRITILTSLTRLRQLSLDPGLVDAAYENIGSAKLDELVDRLTEISGEGHRALVFSQFTGFLKRARLRLGAAGIETVYLDGATRRRPEVIDRFRTGTAPAFLISLKAGGVGLTLTEADYCFLLDPWWNPAAETQAVDRTHRIGQTRSVMVYRMVAANTIEQRVVELAARKADLYRSVLDADGELSTGLTAADIASLLER